MNAWTRNLRFVSWGPFVVLIVGFAASSAPAQDGFLNLEYGFASHARAAFAPDNFVGGMVHTPSGDLIIYKGSDLLLLRDDGSETPLATFDPPVVGAFLTLAPDGAAVYFGESSAGDIFRVPVAGGSADRVDNISFNYDLAFDPSGRGFVSTGAASEQRIVLLDSDPNGALVPVIVGIPGFSGPLAFDDAGNLYYGTADFLAESQSLHRFTPQQLETAVQSGPIDFAVGDVVLEGVVGFNQMVFDGSGNIFFSDLGFATGFGSVQAIDISDNFEMVPILETSVSDGIVSPTYLAFRPGPEAFEPGVGAGGGSLSVLFADFFSVNVLRTVQRQLFFVRGELNGDGDVDLSDILVLLGFVFLGQEAPSPLEAGDMNDDGELDLADALYALNYLFQAGPAIPAPFPEPGPAPER